jgi:hypothetical protein
LREEWGRAGMMSAVFFDGFVGFLVEILREFLEGQRLYVEEKKVRKVWLRSLKRVL